jgi:EAL domain-containing protein (putative c-di-GMP-specific phosphodiesterase class I)
LRYFSLQHGPIELAINLPIAFLRDPDFVESVRRQMPDNSGLEAIMIEINGTDVVRNFQLVKEVAKQLRFHNIAVSTAMI